MDKYTWIRDLVRAEEQMEESGVVDFGDELDADRFLVAASLEYLAELKDAFIQAAEVFNDLKPSPQGRIKVYGIAKTHADFMLFRSGFKLIFSLKQPGLVAIRFHFMNASFASPQPGSSALNYQSLQSLMDEDILEARWGAFNEIQWHHKGQPIKLENIVRYYLSRFVKESAK